MEPVRIKQTRVFISEPTRAQMDMRTIQTLEKMEDPMVPCWSRSVSVSTGKSVHIAPYQRFDCEFSLFRELAPLGRVIADNPHTKPSDLPFGKQDKYWRTPLDSDWPCSTDPYFVLIEEMRFRPIVREIIEAHLRVTDFDEYRFLDESDPETRARMLPTARVLVDARRTNELGAYPVDTNRNIEILRDAGCRILKFDKWDDPKYIDIAARGLKKWHQSKQPQQWWHKSNHPRIPF